MLIYRFCGKNEDEIVGFTINLNKQRESDAFFGGSMKLAWLIDTTTYIDDNVDSKDVFVVSLSTIIDGKPYKDTEFESSNVFLKC